MSRDKQTGYHISKETVDKIFPKKDIDILGYESPIKVIMGQMRMEQENNIYKAIQDYGVDVDKEELIKALRYDRGQYEEGFLRGYSAGLEQKASDLAEEIFAGIEKALDNSVETEHFKGTWFNFSKFKQMLAELKKKYIGEDNNVPTNTEDK